MSFSYPFADDINLYVQGRVLPEDAERQKRTAKEILRRLKNQPGIILADEVGMGKTFVALAVAVSVVIEDNFRNPVIVMVPPSLREKWPRDFQLFKEKCLPQKIAEKIRSAAAERAIEFLKLLDDPPDRRNNLIFLTHGALSRGLTDQWVKWALINRALYNRKNTSNLRRALCRVAGRLISMAWVDRRCPEVWSP
ncbi:MAG TPA: hypothetical protein ENH52_10845, partial [Nitrospirae bacterium]|nr:hypothetical protein [Nitrospirota bacterium]